MTSIDETTETQGVRITGQVKWFNNKAGYGFITVNSGDEAGKDIFIHYSAIRVTNSQYKYLIQGEYVEFELTKSTSDSHEFQAVNVSGINSGPLMCETRRNNVVQSDVTRQRPPVAQQRRYRVQREYDGPPPRQQRPSRPQQQSTDDYDGSPTRQQRPSRPQHQSADASGFIPVQRKSNNYKKKAHVPAAETAVAGSA